MIGGKRKKVQRQHEAKNKRIYTEHSTRKQHPSKKTEGVALLLYTRASSKRGGKRLVSTRS